jgi:hypothetical protein
VVSLTLPIALSKYTVTLLMLITQYCLMKRVVAPIQIDAFDALLSQLVRSIDFVMVMIGWLIHNHWYFCTKDCLDV